MSAACPLEIIANSKPEGLAEHRPGCSVSVTPVTGKTNNQARRAGRHPSVLPMRLMRLHPVRPDGSKPHPYRSSSVNGLRLNNARASSALYSACTIGPLCERGGEAVWLPLCSGSNPTPDALPASMGCASTMFELARHCIRLAPLVPFEKGEGRPLLPIGEESPTCVSIQRFRRISSLPLPFKKGEGLGVGFGPMHNAQCQPLGKG